MNNGKLIIGILSCGFFCISSIGGHCSDQRTSTPDTYKKIKKASFSLEFKPSVTYTGILPKAFTTPKPYELINPFAASSYGYGKDMVSWSSKEGKPKGFIFFGVRFW